MYHSYKLQYTKYQIQIYANNQISQKSPAPECHEAEIQHQKEKRTQGSNQAIQKIRCRRKGQSQRLSETGL